jgi:hypothetical protein
MRSDATNDKDQRERAPLAASPLLGNQELMPAIRTGYRNDPNPTGIAPSRRMLSGTFLTCEWSAKRRTGIAGPWMQTADDAEAQA